MHLFGIPRGVFVRFHLTFGASAAAARMIYIIGRTCCSSESGYRESYSSEKIAGIILACNVTLLIRYTVVLQERIIPVICSEQLHSLFQGLEELQRPAMTEDVPPVVADAQNARII